MPPVQHRTVVAALRATDDALKLFTSAKKDHALELLTSAKKDLEDALKPSTRGPRAGIQKNPTALQTSLRKIKRDPDTFNFEGLPAEMRLKVYRELLVSPMEIDPVHGRDAMRFHPAILRVSRKIHNEADAVLYGENVFASTIFKDYISKLWHRPSSRKTLIPRSSSCKISQIHLYITFTNNFYSSKIPGIITVNAGLAAKKLSLNNLKPLKVTFNHQRPHHPLKRTSSVDQDYSSEGGQRWENCIEP